MNHTLELHVSGLAEGETPTFRIQPVGPDAGPPVFLEPADFTTLSEILDRLSKEPSPNWHSIRQAVLNAFYEPATTRG
jgi:hypothetical protein